jgi:hypothetical protein
MSQSAPMMPRISVIIPTFRRPVLLRRAILSCLAGTHADVTEVIVVPNGPDTSWQQVRAEFDGDQRVVIQHCDVVDQNAARNAGIDLARGELIRFLDDDDYLFPDVAARQYDLMFEHGLDASSASISMRDQDDRHLGDLAQPAPGDVVRAALAYDRLQIPFAHVYRRTSIGSLRWPDGMKQSEDIVWLIRFAAARERTWQRFDEPVGVWFQHDSPRMSVDRPSGRVYRPTASALIESAATLESQGRWTPEVARTASDALWQCVHRAMHFDPAYWTGVALKAMKMDPGGRPHAPIYQYRGVRNIHPLVLQWLLLPSRWALHLIRIAKGTLFGWNYRRSM